MQTLVCYSFKRTKVRTPKTGTYFVSIMKSIDYDTYALDGKKASDTIR